MKGPCNYIIAWIIQKSPVIKCQEIFGNYLEIMEFLSKGDVRKTCTIDLTESEFALDPPCKHFKEDFLSMKA